MSAPESQLQAMWTGIYRKLEPQATPVLADNRTINFLIDGGGVAITTGVKGYLVVDFPCRITGVDLLADVTGSAVVDVLRSTFATFPTFVSLTAAARPTLTAAQKYQDSTLTGWTTAITPGDVLEYNVFSASTVKLLLLSLRVRRG